MEDDRWLAERFEDHRARLRSLAYRMLGSLAEADDAVQDTWLRLHHSDPDEIDNLGGWLTTVTARVCLNLLRARTIRREELLGDRLPDPVVTADRAADPAEEAVLADSISLALLVVLDSLTPAERLAFVLHDLFSLPFDEIAPMVGRSPAAARQLASRARRRVQGAAIPQPDADQTRQRAVVDAFYAAARGGELDTLVALLHPDAVLRSDFGGRRRAAPTLVRGAVAVAEQARLGALPGAEIVPAQVNGSAGAVITVHGRPFAVMGFTVVDGLIAEIDAIADPGRVRRIAAAVLGSAG